MTGRTARRAIGVLIACLVVAAALGARSAAADTNPTASCSSGALVYVGLGGLHVFNLPSCTTAPIACPDGCKAQLTANYSGQYTGTALRWRVQRNGGSGWTDIASGTCGPGAAACGNVAPVVSPIEGGSAVRAVCDLQTPGNVLAVLVSESETCTLTVSLGL